jgi:hypothetical protein
MMFWTPAFAGVTTKETFYELIKIVIPAKAGIQSKVDAGSSPA